MVTDDNFLYIKFNHNIISSYKSKKYLGYVAQFFPREDLHHLFKKGVDYLIFGFEHTYHLKTVHQKRAYYFALYLDRSINLLLHYADNELKIPPEQLEKFKDQREPKIIEEFFRLLQKAEKTHKLK